MTQVVQGILIPFLGTTLGAACALFLKNNLPTSVQRILTGFAAGIMTAASVWSLLIPALEQESDRGRLAFLPAAIGFLVGIAFLLLLDRLIPHLHMNSKEAGVSLPLACCSEYWKSSLLSAVSLRGIHEHIHGL